MRHSFLALSLVTALAASAFAQTPAVPKYTSHGTVFGTQTSSGFSGWGATPVAQYPNGTDPLTALQGFGLIATGTNPVTSSANVTRSGTSTGGVYVGPTITSSTFSGTNVNSGTVTGGTYSGATISASTFNGVNILSGTASPLASGTYSTIPALYFLTTATNSSAPYSEYILASGSNNWRPVTTGTGP